MLLHDGVEGLIRQARVRHVHDVDLRASVLHLESREALTPHPATGPEVLVQLRAVPAARREVHDEQDDAERDQDDRTVHVQETPHLGAAARLPVNSTAWASKKKRKMSRQFQSLADPSC
ncbi:hypothetical protein OED01_02840 [Microbacterium sp. M28]|uniref:hypothetical protein n=1 Tax=Microbacterium sp. M28 TaxID=2962064 RepID=UPI0021F3F105|nr:hypothetical protein [Microbacterium sp. M28]UYO97674.1 hypothetical protein OED01_02840 [Microbacterium sp. M28]